MGARICEILLYIVIAVIIAVISGIIIERIKSDKFRDKTNEQVQKLWSIMKAFWFKYWIRIVFLILFLVSCTLNNHFNIPFDIPLIFLFALSIWLTIVVYFEKRPLKKSPAIFCILGDPESEKGKNGLEFVDYDGDGRAVRGFHKNIYARRTNNKEQQHYIYFAINDECAPNFRNKDILIIVEFLDLSQEDTGKNKGRRSLLLWYDDGKGNRCKKGGEIIFTGSNTWKQGVFLINDGVFRKGQQEKADFRLASIAPDKETDYDIIVKRVILVPLDTEIDKSQYTA